MVFAIVQFVDQRKFCVAQTARGSYDGVENWLKLNFGAVDCVEDIARRFLPLQGLGQFALKAGIALLHIDARVRTLAFRLRVAFGWWFGLPSSALRHEGALRPGEVFQKNEYRRQAFPIGARPFSV